MSGDRKQRAVSVDARGDHLRGQFFAMGSPCEILCDTDDQAIVRNLADLAAAEAWRIEDKFSRYLAGNIIDKINSANGAPIDVDEETARLMDFSVSLYEMSGHRFDITSGVLRSVWNFDGSDKVPEPATVDEVKTLVGWHRVSWQSPTLVMPADMQIDFGGIGKEYAVDRVANELREHFAGSCLINFGGDLAVTRPPGKRPHWSVGIEGVDSDGAVAEVLINLRSGALATSGDARRFVYRDGIRYGHILDPLTGWPIPDAPRAVTVAAETCVQAGMLSTLAMLEGANAESFLTDQAIKHWCYRDGGPV